LVKKYIFVPLFSGSRKQSADEFSSGVKSQVIPYKYMGLPNGMLENNSANEYCFLKNKEYLCSPIFKNK